MQNQFANPFPMAAVVFPAASKASVISLISCSKFDISEIPLVLSENWSYASIAKLIDKFKSVPNQQWRYHTNQVI